MRPPAANSFMPLSSNGLWLAEITAPAAPARGELRDTRGREHAHEHEVGTLGADACHERGFEHRSGSVLVMDGARLIEVGAHDELMAKGGHYAELYGIQAAAYR